MESNGRQQEQIGEDAATLMDIALSAEQFCSRVEAGAQDMAPTRDYEELRLKIAQCRTLLRRVQDISARQQLRIEDPSIRADFRYLIMTLLWMAFYGRAIIDFRLFRKLVLIEANFTYLLVSR
jgi:hypothetical protein